ASPPVLAHVDVEPDGVGIQTADGNAGVWRHGLHTDFGPVDVGRAHAAAAEGYRDMVPGAVDQFTGHVRTVPAAIQAVFQIPLHAIVLGVDHPAQVAAVVPVFVRDEGLVISLVINFRPEGEREVGGIAGGVTAEFEDGRVAQGDIIVDHAILGRGDAYALAKLARLEAGRVDGRTEDAGAGRIVV